MSKKSVVANLSDMTDNQLINEYNVAAMQRESNGVFLVQLNESLKKAYKAQDEKIFEIRRYQTEMRKRAKSYK